MANISIVLNAKDNASHVISGAGEIITGAFRRIGEMGINALASAGGALVGFAKDSFAGAIEAQAGMDKLRASITRMGDAAPVSMDAAMGLADQFKNLVGGSDDAVLAMANVGLRFDQIGKDTFPRFIEQSADLAATLGIEGPRAAEILGKTLQDFSTDGAGALGRLKAAGVTLTDQQEEQIKKMIEAGDAAGAQTLLLDALAATTGGAAAAAAGTFAGQMAIFNETVADAGEGVALALLPALTALAAEVLPQLIPVITEVATAATDFIVNILIPAFMQAVEWVQTNWPTIQAQIAAGWAAMQPVFQAVGDFITVTLIPAFQSIVDWVIVNWPTIQATAEQVFAAVSAAFDTAIKAINDIWVIFQPAFEGNFTQFGENLRKGFDETWEAIKKAVGDAIDWFGKQDWAAIGTNILKGIAGGITAATQFISEAAQAAAQAAIDTVKGFLGISSPSKVFAGLGENMMAGMAQGIAGASYMPSNAMLGAAGNTYSSAMSVTMNINGAGNPGVVGAEVKRQLDGLGRSADGRMRTR